MNKIRVKIVYRNYKPIHTTYDSFISHPPKDVEFEFPKVKTNLARFMPIYRKFGDKKPVKLILKQLQERVFEKNKYARKNNPEIINYDIIHYIQICPSEVPAVPFIIDIEHVAALINFVKYSKQEIERIARVLAHDNCKAIIALSNASKLSLENFVKGHKDADQIINKTQVIYPAVENYSALYQREVKSEHEKTIIHDLNILFVGNNPYNKGLFELLEAVKKLKNPNIKIKIITNVSTKLIKKWQSNSIKFYKPIFSHKEVIKKFFLTSDLFVLPTRGDTFGMALLDALSSGLPVIATRQYAIKEIIKDGINGYLLNSQNTYLEKYYMPTRKIVNSYNKRPVDGRLVDKLAEKIDILYKDRDLLKRMAKNAVKDFTENGRFAISYRNDKLTSVYKNALNEKIH